MILDVLRLRTALAMLAGVILAAPAAASPREDVQRIGLQPLYGALVAVANCPLLAIDQPRFRAVASQYHLTPEDLTLQGPFAAEIARLARFYRIRVLDDREAFCSAARLTNDVVVGILKDAPR